MLPVPWGDFMRLAGLCTSQPRTLEAHGFPGRVNTSVDWRNQSSLISPTNSEKRVLILFSHREHVSSVLSTFLGQPDVLSDCVHLASGPIDCLALCHFPKSAFRPAGCKEFMPEY